ncbi:MAG TPA: CPBP family intramembrane glutamic endopeptidase, partial [Sunxiuqinia sp.]|nr:CPBP family intramembrane glutamic endopeptidase [Sunxiuqinia sp.]
SVFYPIFSASTQEMIYRTFLFHRYEKLFGSGIPIIMASAVTFSFAHIFFFHPLSMILTFLLGIYLGYLYYQKRSVVFVALLHGLYGNMIFTVGLGEYFWLDMGKYLH